ncbi:hypothetical protein A2U01_0078209 [Trifolium medium]|uniref:Uncharacterized protein n=1 Tax=Trifolium medium TaxID=97028 RepID=A0A392T7B7_9FABA|nr:hypothetical protein [Trifolium medium]
MLIRPEGCTWGMPQNSVNEEFRPVISEIPAPIVPRGVCPSTRSSYSPS